MAAEFITPTCETTGLPLPIIPTEPRTSGVFSFPETNRTNRHHALHPNSDPLLANATGRALRGCRVQKTRVDLHNYYHRTFSGPELPTSEDKAFEIVVFGVAGVLPREGIEMHGKHDWTQREISPDEYQKLSAPNAVQFEKAKTIARFISNYSLEQSGPSFIDRLEIEEFVDRKTPYIRRRELASLILGESLDVSLADLAPTHEQLKQEGLVVEKRSKTLRHAAKSLVRKHAFSYFSEILFDRFAYE